MTRINFAYILLILALLTSCDNNYSYKKEDEKTKFKIVDLSYVNDKFIHIFDINFENKTYSGLNECKYRVSNNRKLLLDTNNDFELEFRHNIFPSDRYNNGVESGYNYFVGYNKENEIGYLIGWRNIGDYIKPITWEVGSQTDSLISTLSHKSIKKMFPNFKGNYTQVKVDSIVIPYFTYMTQEMHVLGIILEKEIYLPYTRIFGNHKWFRYKNYFDKIDLQTKSINYTLEDKYKDKEKYGMPYE